MKYQTLLEEIQGKRRLGISLRGKEEVSNTASRKAGSSKDYFEALGNLK